MGWFYLVKQNELVLGPFQGPIACTRIAKGRGVCGTAWQQLQVIIVPDVELFRDILHVAQRLNQKSYCRLCKIRNVLVYWILIVMNSISLMKSMPNICSNLFLLLKHQLLIHKGITQIDLSYTSIVRTWYYCFTLLWDVLNHIPMLDNFPIFNTENINNRSSPICIIFS